MNQASPTIEEQLRAAITGMTRTERQLATHSSRNYPVAALGSISLRWHARPRWPTPTVVRLVQKLGFRGYPDFQSSVRSEVEDMPSSPLAKHDRAGQAGRPIPIF
ncbi:MAG: hypothetical protein R3D84_08950 [Paracoccaceae bacterium]